MDRSTRRALFGTLETEPPVIPLRAGPLALRLQGTRLLAVEAAGHEVWHGVALLYRDPGWGTPEPVVDDCDCRREEDGFAVDIRAHVPSTPVIDLRIRIVGDASGRVRYEGTAVPRGDIATQRTGIVVMHPMSAMGGAVEIGHDDGRVSRSSLPRRVPPWPPFTLVRSVRHTFADGAWATCRLSGDVFEFEDQRNNADASFKTYGRSNAMPRPYRLRAGVAVTQAAEFALDRVPARPLRRPAPSIALDAALDRAPVVGVGLGPEDLRDARRLRARVAALAPIPLHLVLDTVHDAVDLDALARCVAASGRPLRLDVRDAGAPGDAAFDDFAALAGRLRAAGIPTDAVAAFPGDALTVAALRGAFPGAAVGGGTPHFFAQVNRVEDLGPVDFLSFTVSAIVHGADDASPMRGLRCLPSLVETLRDRWPGPGVRVGPSGIAAPRSPLGAQPDSDGTRRIALARHDPRSGALYGAAWLVGHLGGLASCGVQAASVRGLGERDGLFAAGEGAGAAPTPAGWVLRELAGLAGVRAVRLSRPDATAALAFRRAGGEDVVLVANLGAAPLRLDVRGLPEGESHAIDAGSWTSCRDGLSANPWRPLPPQGGHWRLPAYAVARHVARHGA
jgi:hypothetical protein